MIKVEKRAGPPSALATRGADTTSANCSKYEADPASYTAGTETFSFDSTVYAHHEVKAALLEAQHGKCAFCESRFTHIAYGDVEHFRPKGGFQQNEDDELGRPGYYWLAYSWANLFLACQLCNQRYKRNLFPLRVQRDRALSHEHDLSAEQQLLVDPSIEPERHISFADEMAIPRNRSVSGRVSIDALGLNRPPLLESRLTWSALLKAMLKAKRDLTAHAGTMPSHEQQETIDVLTGLLANAVSNSAQYAAMARSMLG